MCSLLRHLIGSLVCLRRDEIMTPDEVSNLARSLVGCWYDRLAVARFEQLARERTMIPIRLIQLAASFMTVALLASSCGGGDPQVPGTVADATVIEEAPTVDTVPSATSQVETGGGELGELDEEAADVESPSDPVEDDDPWAVTVLTVNAGTQIVPAFDAPNGASMTLYDINEIDDVELEYPLYGQTAFGNPLALVVEQFDVTGAWAKVLVPVRPNGTTTWVQTSYFSESTHNYRIIIDLSENTVNVYRGDELLIEQLVASGSEELPTPVVRAFVDEKIPGGDVGPDYGAWILSIAAFSESLGTFGGGGTPKLALHGTNQPELMGQYITSGGVRVPDDIISLIAETVPVGTIVEIVD